MVEIGSRIGNYEVLQKIGEGAMGVVFLARHPTIGKRVALKVIHPELSADEDVVARFFNEARAVTQIGHHNIVDVQDFGQTPSGESFLVMELLEGIGLGELLRKTGPLPIERAVKIAVQLTDGLQAAHARGIVHRDLKPDNIFLIQRGNEPDFVKILDFGLAKLTGPGAISQKTKTGVLVGTPHYMAPEAAEEPRKADHRIDVYSLGCILFEMVVGRVPFPGDGFGEVVVRHLREPPPLPRRLREDTPAWLEKLILHALAKKQAFRLGTMEAFGNALRDPELFERSFDDDEISSKYALLRDPSAPAEAPEGPAPVRQAQLAPDAKTMSAPAPTEIDRIAPDFGHFVPPVATPAKPKLLGPILGSIAIMSLGFAVAGFILYSKVRVTIQTTPVGAQLYLDGKAAGVSPAKLHIKWSKTPVGLVVERSGYTPVRATIDPTHDTKLDFVLVAIAPPPPEVHAPTPEPVAATPKPLHFAKPRPKKEKEKPAFHHDGMLMAPTF